MPQLTVSHVSKQYPTRGEPLVVLRDISLTLAAGQNAAIVGPSGSGKSTLLNVIGTLDPPSTGQVEFDGENPYALREPQLAAFRSRHIGFVFQNHHLLPQLSVLENVLLPTLAGGRSRPEEITRARELIDRVGLSGRLEHRPGELSGGERQRVAIARAMIHRPTLLLADEPTGNLDRAAGASIGQLMLELQQQEDSILLVVTHSQELAALMQRQFELVDGQFAGDAPIATEGAT